MRRTSTAVIGLVASLALVGAACGSDDSDASSSVAPAASEAPAASDSPATEAPSMSEAPAANGGSGAMSTGEPFGAACASVPADGAGSFDGMAQDPAATAASNNPALSTLVSAVQAAGLVDTLNGPGPFTIFAPANSAFDKIDKATLDTLLADPTGDLTKILTYHVVAGQQLDAEQLVEAGTVPTVEGADVTVTMDGDALKVNDSTVVCGNVQTANATVYIIDGVLMPMS
jgi:transforming growth factor-beta-induced protein